MKTNKQKPFQKQAVEQIHEEAMEIAKGIQRPEQTKQQTKLVAKGIAQGIEIYKKRQKEKARKWDREKKKIARGTGESEETDLKMQINREPERGNRTRYSLGFCGLLFGSMAVLFEALYMFNVAVKIGAQSFSNEYFILVGIVMFVLSIWMFWARRK